MANPNNVELEAAKFMEKVICECKDEPTKLAAKLYVILEHMKATGYKNSLPYQVTSSHMGTLVEQNSLDVDALTSSWLPSAGVTQVGESGPSQAVGSSQRAGVTKDPKASLKTNELIKPEVCSSGRMLVGPSNSGHDIYQGSPSLISGPEDMMKTSCLFQDEDEDSEWIARCLDLNRKDYEQAKSFNVNATEDMMKTSCLSQNEDEDFEWIARCLDLNCVDYKQAKSFNVNATGQSDSEDDQRIASCLDQNLKDHKQANSFNFNVTGPEDMMKTSCLFQNEDEDSEWIARCSDLNREDYEQAKSFNVNATGREDMMKTSCLSQNEYEDFEWIARCLDLNCVDYKQAKSFNANATGQSDSEDDQRIASCLDQNRKDHKQANSFNFNATVDDQRDASCLDQNHKDYKQAKSFNFNATVDDQRDASCLDQNHKDYKQAKSFNFNATGQSDSEDDQSSASCLDQNHKDYEQAKSINFNTNEAINTFTPSLTKPNSISATTSPHNLQDNIPLCTEMLLARSNQEMPPETSQLQHHLIEFPVFTSAYKSNSSADSASGSEKIKMRNNQQTQKCASASVSIQDQGKARMLDMEYGINRDILDKYSGKKLKDVADILGVSRSTLKRICRKNHIFRWPPCKEGKHKNSLQEYGKTTEGNNNPRNDPSPDLQLLQREPDLHMARTVLDLKASGNAAKVIMVKATYGNDMFKFQLSLSSTKLDLEKEISARVKLPIDSFKIKYLDEDNDWVSIACDDDLRTCMGTLTSSGNTTVKMLLDKV